MVGRFSKSLIYRVILAVTLAGGSSLTGLSILIGSILVSPAVAVIGPPPPDLPGAQEVHIPSASGSLLQGWWIPASRPGAGAVILLHGIRNNRLSMLPRARHLAEAGFAVLLFDFQAHGQSSGRHITGGKLEALDAAAAVRFVQAHSPSERIGIIGTSLGAAAALLGPQPLDVQAMVLESVYSDIDLGFSNWIHTLLDPDQAALATPPLTLLLDDVLLPLIGVAPLELRPIDHIGAVVAPILLASGTEDRVTPVSMTRTLFARARAAKQFVLVYGATHADLETFAPERYWATVLPFLNTNLQSGAMTLSAQ